MDINSNGKNMTIKEKICRKDYKTWNWSNLMHKDNINYLSLAYSLEMKSSLDLTIYGWKFGEWNDDL